MSTPFLLLELDIYIHLNMPNVSNLLQIYGGAKIGGIEVVRATLTVV